MTPEKLDLLFPFLVLGYGVTMTLVLNTPFFADLAEKRLPHPVAQQIRAHRGLGLVCLIVGGCLVAAKSLALEGLFE
ncbi:MAG: hypothetical protein HC902_12110 [Calothrix sp. SM1_5_4]|nr:hypothetical protein [Calothrix sp. SM1_5_4]